LYILKKRADYLLSRKETKMSARGKRWLRKMYKQGPEFEIVPEDGGYAGSLVGLGYIVEVDPYKFRLTSRGLRWINNV
jgi:hypothetical protein